MIDFTDRVAFITGGASGAGFGQATVFGRAGARIAIADVRRDSLDDAVARLREAGIDAWGVPLDVTDRNAYARAADDVEDHFGDPVTLLFNTAGVNGFGSIETMTYADFDWMLGVNFGGVVNGMVTFVPRMIAAGRGGHVTSVASVGGFEGGRMVGPYSAAKAAVISLMESYAQALPEHGIGVTVLCPASIRSGIAEAHETRPETGAESGVLVDDGFVASLREVYSHGMDPEHLAMHLKRAIEAGELYAIPYPEVREQLERTFGNILDAVPDIDEIAPHGAQQRLEALEAFRAGSRRRVEAETRVP
ncbi:dehydrogenase [Microbacterium sp. Root61]|uniref:SDR family NAD(P)-dependent oxidoreductase n=1 Tax=Microbacterium sp. Root61 TaxID=1736570 RepID=UPI0006FB98D0|nr:SDR family NAD(P)-dependent oxidoreductase [Microbacterium sp. Root61]KRA25303.1 dehydrogenase [Microbacterium sp. Root61]